jgi:hypothetical protein
VNRVRRGLIAFAVTLTGLLALAGCGVPSDSVPRAVPAEQVDPRLLAAPSPTPTPTPTGASVYRVAFVTPDNTLQLIPRPIPPASALEQVQQLLAQLAAGPNDVEHARGLSTALPSDVTLTLSSLQQGEAIVAINGATDPRQPPLSVAQVVLTLTSHPDVRAVSLTSDGRPVEAPLADGFIAHRPLTARDYQSFLADARTPTATRGTAATTTGGPAASPAGSP